MSEALLGPVTLEEVQEAVFQMGTIKASGLDRMVMYFFASSTLIPPLIKLILSLSLKWHIQRLSDNID